MTGAEVTAILMQRHVKVDGKVRTDSTYPAGYMDVVDIAKTDEHFRLVYDAKGRFVTHRITKVSHTRLSSHVTVKILGPINWQTTAGLPHHHFSLGKYFAPSRERGS